MCLLLFIHNLIFDNYLLIWLLCFLLPSCEIKSYKYFSIDRCLLGPNFSVAGFLTMFQSALRFFQWILYLCILNKLHDFLVLGYRSSMILITFPSVQGIKESIVIILWTIDNQDKSNIQKDMFSFLFFSHQLNQGGFPLKELFILVFKWQMRAKWNILNSYTCGYLYIWLSFD